MFFSPLLSPLSDLWSSLLQCEHSRDIKLGCWFDTFRASPSGSCLLWLLVFVLGCWVAASVTGYWSYVDRLWSVTPVVYAVVYTFHPNVAAPLPLAITGCVCVWGLRLSLNFARKGGYGDEEDYRWGILRAWFAKHDPLHPVGTHVFAFLFVALYQHVLLMLLVQPVAEALTQMRPLIQWSQWDTVTCCAMLLCVGVETYVDEVQWRFQSAKSRMSPQARATAGGDYALGFLTTGPFALSRHLNFAAEQGVWWCFAAFAARRGAWWACTGAGLLTLLFLGSTTMTEAISVARHPAYAQYQQTTSRLLPWWPGERVSATEAVQQLKSAPQAWRESGGHGKTR